MIPRCHVEIALVNTFSQQFSTQLVYQSYIFLIRASILLVSCYLNRVCTRQVLLLINAA